MTKGGLGKLRMMLKENIFTMPGDNRFFRSRQQKENQVSTPDAPKTSSRGEEVEGGGVSGWGRKIQQYKRVAAKRPAQAQAQAQPSNAEVCDGGDGCHMAEANDSDIRKSWEEASKRRRSMDKVARSPAQVVSPKEKVAETPAQVVSPMEKLARAPAQVVTPNIEKVARTPAQVVSPMEKLARTTPAQVVTPNEKVAETRAQVVTPKEKVARTPAQVVTPKEKVARAPAQVVTPVEEMATTTPAHPVESREFVCMETDCEAVPEGVNNTCEAVPVGDTVMQDVGGSSPVHVPEVVQDAGVNDGFTGETAGTLHTDKDDVDRTAPMTCSASSQVRVDPDTDVRKSSSQVRLDRETAVKPSMQRSPSSRKRTCTSREKLNEEAIYKGGAQEAPPRVSQAFRNAEDVLMCQCNRAAELEDDVDVVVVAAQDESTSENTCVDYVLVVAGGDESNCADAFRGLLADRDELKASEHYKKAQEEEWRRRQEEVQRQAAEVQRLRKKKKAEGERKLATEQRMKQRLQEMNQNKMEEAKANDSKDRIRSRCQAELRLKVRGCQDMAALLMRLGVKVEGGQLCTPEQVSAAYKKACMRFHPDRGMNKSLQAQVEAEETFKLLSSKKSELPLLLSRNLY